MAKIQKTKTERKQERLWASLTKKKKASHKKVADRVVRKKRSTKPALSATHLIGKSYWYFLDSKYWKTVREMVLKRDRYQCRICSTKTGLQVHHDTYKNHFKEHLHLEDLLTICGDCHKEHHYAQA